MVDMLFCRIGWMKYYKGVTPDDHITGGGSYVDEKGYGHEIYNFLPDTQGNIYGFVQVTGDSMTISRLGAKYTAPSINGITIVWCSPHNAALYIVGWYKNATVYSRTQHYPKSILMTRPLPDPKDRLTYRFTTKKQYAELLPVEERIFEVPRAPKDLVGFGRQNIWYPDSKEAKDYYRKVQEYIQSIDNNKRRIHKVGQYHPDIAKRQTVEIAAMKSTIEYYQSKRYIVEDVSNENKGWDIEASKDTQVLYIECKGLSGNLVSVEVTPNEYKQMKNLSNYGKYRLCILENALLDTRQLYHFHYDKTTNSLSEESGTMRLQIEERLGARLKYVT